MPRPSPPNSPWLRAGLSRPRPYDGTVNRRPGPLRRAVALAAAVLATAASLTWSTSAAAAATPQVTVEITGVTATGSRPSDRVTVTGRVSNPTGAQVYGLVMAMWRSRDPIDDLAALRQVTASTPSGVILSGTQKGSYAQITAQNVAFVPGAVAEFTVQATLDDLGFDEAGKAYLVGARAVGTAVGSDDIGKVGQGQTVLAIPGKPVPVTRLVVFGATPTKLADGVFRNENLIAELTGRLDGLLTAAAEPGMSWLIDPALFDEVTDLADGYQVRSGDDLVPGTGQRVASAWLTRFRRLDPAAGARSLFGDPDLTGAAAAGDPEVLARARAADEQVVALSGLRQLVWPTGGVYTDALDAYLDDDLPILAGNAVDAGALQASGTGRTVLTATTLPADPTDFAARQLSLAQTVLAGRTGQLRLLREPADLIADAATTTDWQQPRPLGELLEGKPRTGSFAAAEPATLGPADFEAVAGLEQAVAAYRQLAPDSVIPDEAAGLLTRAVSQAWIGQDEAHAALLKDVDQLFGPAALKSAVELDASARFVMAGRTSQFPLTVTNNLAEPIQVKVRMDTDNPQRLRIPDSEVVTIAPGQNASILVHPEATANGVAIAHAWVATVSGRRVSPSIQITVEMTELGFIGWVIVIASGAVVLGATALRIWQVRRKAKRDATPAADAESQPSAPAPGPGAEPSPATVALGDPGSAREPGSGEPHD